MWERDASQSELSPAGPSGSFIISPLKPLKPANGSHRALPSHADQPVIGPPQPEPAPEAASQATTSGPSTNENPEPILSLQTDSYERIYAQCGQVTPAGGNSSSNGQYLLDPQAAPSPMEQAVGISSIFPGVAAMPPPEPESAQQPLQLPLERPIDEPGADETAIVATATKAAKLATAAVATRMERSGRYPLSSTVIAGGFCGRHLPDAYDAAEVSAFPDTLSVVKDYPPILNGPTAPMAIGDGAMGTETITVTERPEIPAATLILATQVSSPATAATATAAAAAAAAAVPGTGSVAVLSLSVSATAPVVERDPALCTAASGPSMQHRSTTITDNCNNINQKSETGMQGLRKALRTSGGETSSRAVNRVVEVATTAATVTATAMATASPSHLFSNVAPVLFEPPTLLTLPAPPHMAALPGLPLAPGGLLGELHSRHPYQNHLLQLQQPDLQQPETQLQHQGMQQNVMAEARTEPVPGVLAAPPLPPPMPSPLTPPLAFPALPTWPTFAFGLPVNPPNPSQLPLPPPLQLPFSPPLPALLPLPLPVPVPVPVQLQPAEGQEQQPDQSQFQERQKQQQQQSPLTANCVAQDLEIPQQRQQEGEPGSGPGASATTAAVSLGSTPPPTLPCSSGAPRDVPAGASAAASHQATRQPPPNETAPTGSPYSTESVGGYLNSNPQPEVRVHPQALARGGAVVKNGPIDPLPHINMTMEALPQSNTGAGSPPGVALPGGELGCSTKLGPFPDSLSKDVSLPLMGAAEPRLMRAQHVYVGAAAGEQCSGAGQQQQPAHQNVAEQHQQQHQQQQQQQEAHPHRFINPGSAAATAAAIGFGAAPSADSRRHRAVHRAVRTMKRRSGFGAPPSLGCRLAVGENAGAAVGAAGGRGGQRGAHEGAFKYIVQVGDKWRAQVGHMEGGVQRKYYSSYVRSAAQAARDADKLLYKLRGPSFPLNFTLADTERQSLDDMSLQDLLQQLHPSQDSALMAAAVLVDLSRDTGGGDPASRAQHVNRQQHVHQYLHEQQRHQQLLRHQPHQQHPQHQNQQPQQQPHHLFVERSSWGHAVLPPVSGSHALPSATLGFSPHELPEIEGDSCELERAAGSGSASGSCAFIGKQTPGRDRPMRLLGFVAVDSSLAAVEGSKVGGEAIDGIGEPGPAVARCGVKEKRAASGGGGGGGSGGGGSRSGSGDSSYATYATGVTCTAAASASVTAAAITPAAVASAGKTSCTADAVCNARPSPCMEALNDAARRRGASGAGAGESTCIGVHPAGGQYLSEAATRCNTGGEEALLGEGQAAGAVTAAAAIATVTATTTATAVKAAQMEPSNGELGLEARASCSMEAAELTGAAFTGDPEGAAEGTWGDGHPSADAGRVLRSIIRGEKSVRRGGGGGGSRRTAASAGPVPAMAAAATAATARTFNQLNGAAADALCASVVSDAAACTCGSSEGGVGGGTDVDVDVPEDEHHRMNIGWGALEAEAEMKQHQHQHQQHCGTHGCPSPLPPTAAIHVTKEARTGKRGPRVRFVMNEAPAAADLDSTYCGMMWPPSQLPGQIETVSSPIATAAAPAVSAAIASGPLPSLQAGAGLPLPFPFSCPFPISMPMPMAMPMPMPMPMPMAMAMPPPLAAFHIAAAAAAAAAAATLAAQQQASTQPGCRPAAGPPNSFGAPGPGVVPILPTMEYWRHMAPLTGPVFPLLLHLQPPYPQSHSQPPSELEAPGVQGQPQKQQQEQHWQQQQQVIQTALMEELGTEILAGCARTTGQRSPQRVTTTASVSELPAESRNLDRGCHVKRSGAVRIPSQARSGLFDSGLTDTSQTLLLLAPAPASVSGSPQVQQQRNHTLPPQQCASSTQATKQPLSQHRGQQRPHPQKHLSRHQPHHRALLEGRQRFQQLQHDVARPLIGTEGAAEGRDGARTPPVLPCKAGSSDGEGRGGGGGGSGGAWSHGDVAVRVFQPNSRSFQLGRGSGSGHQSGGGLTQRKRKVASLGGSASGSGDQSRVGSDAESGGCSGGRAAPSPTRPQAALGLPLGRVTAGDAASGGGGSDRGLPNSREGCLAAASTALPPPLALLHHQQQQQQQQQQQRPQPCNQQQQLHADQCHPVQGFQPGQQQKHMEEAAEALRLAFGNEMATATMRVPAAPATATAALKGTVAWAADVAAAAFSQAPDGHLIPSAPAAAAAAAAPVVLCSHDRPPLRYIVRIGSKWRAQVGHTEDGVQRKYYSNYVDDPRVAAKDADRILYKLRGLPAVANSQLSQAERTALDATSLEALMRSFKSDQRQQQ
ncbi:hypothetical protein VaNZ11_003076 [Volvox africanus]|uniref:AP2/ERF domain-containing protein n=1 Tax=Volvox africanus TaxID=51714 RepID=A0ABQ5RTJ4_9CHLO|nr:hypothetical protein VaNZ11_003076 [Volvox africanus]